MGTGSNRALCKNKNLTDTRGPLHNLTLHYCAYTAVSFVTFQYTEQYGIKYVTLPEYLHNGLNL